jgi:dTMP kinase
MFVTFEGGDGSGKTTQARLLAARLTREGRDVVVTREPGGTELGERVRELVLHAGHVAPWAEAALFAAARAQHVAEVIRPELAAGRHVVTDRYAGSSLAYQGFGRGLPVDEVRRLSDWAASGLWPDLTVLLDVPLAAAAERQVGGRPDRLEAAGDEFHERVAAGFRTLAAEDRDRWVVVDGTLGIDEVEAMIWTAVTDRLPDLADDGVRSGEAR